MSAPRLVSITLESFRGFAHEQTIDLDADVVLLRGDNGSGKTSVVDGLLWLLTGEVPRIVNRAKGLRKTPDSDPLVNVYRGGMARVKLVVRDGHGELELERIGTSRAHELYATREGRRLADADQVLAETLGGLPVPQLRTAVTSWGILQQHTILAALDSGADMHARLSSVIGLQRVTAFAASADREQKAAARDEREAKQVLKRLQDQHEAAVIALAEAEAAVQDPDGAARRLHERATELFRRLPDGISVLLKPASIDDLVTLGRAASELEALARVLAEQHSDALAAEAGSIASLDALEASLTQAEHRAAEALTRAPARVQLAAAALELLGDSCPVCGQEIDPGAVRDHLREVLEASRAQAAGAAASQDAVVQARRQLADARTARREAEERRLAEQAASAALRTAVEDGGTFSLTAEWSAPPAAAALAGHATTLRDTLRTLYAETRREVGGQVSELAARVSVLKEELGTATTAAEAARDRAKRATELRGAAHKAAERIVARALERLEPSFAEVFDRLAPHPTFRKLRAKQDIYYNANQIVPEVVDVERQVRANPMTLFSEGQLNVVALSYFLGMALNARDAALPFVVLDDPLQAMDVLSVLGFADLCRRLREHRQLVVTTHDRQLAALLERKLAPRTAEIRTVTHEFGSWTRDGPAIHSEDEPLTPIEPLLRRAS